MRGHSRLWNGVGEEDEQQKVALFSQPVEGTDCASCGWIEKNEFTVVWSANAVVPRKKSRMPQIVGEN